MTTLVDKTEAPLWRAYWELTKPGVVALLMVTAVIGMFLATPGMPPLRVLTFGSLGLALAMMSSAVINQVMDQRINAIMARTRQRPLVQGRVNTTAALFFASLLCVLSLLILTLLINPLTAVLTFFGVIGYLWMTRDRNVLSISPQEELRRHYVLLGFVVVFAVIAYIAASLYTEADAAWHQVTVRDTDFTPTHIALFYFGIPAFIIIGCAAFVYAHTRLPQFHDRVSLSMGILVAGPILIMPNLGYNEWGHTFFYAEELFSAPVHWGFVLLGWSAFAAGGFLVQIITRLIRLSSLEGDAEIADA